MGQKPDPLTFEPENVSYQAGMRPPTLADDGGLVPTAKADPNNQALKSAFDANGGAMDPEARAAREEIERTRGQMSDTIDEISERLDPHVLAQQAKSAVRSATIGKLEDKVSSVSAKVEDTVSGAAIKMQNAGARVQGAVSTAGDNLGDVANRVRDAAVPAGNATSETARTAGAAAARTGRSLATTIRAHPLPAAAVGFGLGCLVSLGVQKLRGPETVNADSCSTAGPYS
ncbi:MAG TPA: DUF3618 domain-containing protein [Chloroflexota bacterium]|nr:DUF3618 domain-containing protein [Chloroflexota bacterium]